MSPLPHALYLFYKESHERLLSFDYILFNGFVHFLLSLCFCFLVFWKWFSFLSNLISGYVFIQASVTVLCLEFFLPSSVEEPGFTARLSNWTQECFVSRWWLLNWKRDSETLTDRTLIYVSFLTYCQMSLHGLYWDPLTSFQRLGSSANCMWRCVWEARR